MRADLEAEGVAILLRKVKAHTEEEDILSGVISLEDQLGNQAADKWAKAGAKPNSTTDDTINSQLDGMVWLIQERQVEVYTNFYQPTREGEKAQMPRPIRSTDNDALIAQGHELERLNSRLWKCRICGQSWHSNQRKVSSPPIDHLQAGNHLVDGTIVARASRTQLANGRHLP